MRLLPHLTKVLGATALYLGLLKKKEKKVKPYKKRIRSYYSDNLKWKVPNREQVKHLLTRSLPLPHHTTACVVWLDKMSHFEKETSEDEDNLYMLLFSHPFLSRQGKEPYGCDTLPASTAVLLVCINSHICNKICMPANVQTPS